MRVTQQLPRRELAPDRVLPNAAPAGFPTSIGTVDPQRVASDMSDSYAHVLEHLHNRGVFLAYLPAVRENAP